MASYPIGIMLEILIPFLALWASEKGEFGRYVGVCCWPLEIAVLVLPLEFLTNDSGSYVVQTIAFPSDTLAIFVLVVFLFWIWAMVDLYYFRQGMKSEKKAV